MSFAYDGTRWRKLPGKALGVKTSASMPSKLLSLRRIAPISKNDVSAVGVDQDSKITNLPSRSHSYRTADHVRRTEIVRLPVP